MDTRPNDPAEEIDALAFQLTPTWYREALGLVHDEGDRLKRIETIRLLH